jgi:hypothetical protein
MKRIHSAKWRSKAAQEQRAAEQAVRDAAKQEAVEVYKTFSELDLEIVVDVRSFTITHLAEPEEIVLPETTPALLPMKSKTCIGSTSSSYSYAWR